MANKTTYLDRMEASEDARAEKASVYPMSVDEYSAFVQSRANKEDSDRIMAAMTLGLVCEVSELVAIMTEVASVYRPPQDLLKKAVLEMGDVEFYISDVAARTGSSLCQVLALGIDHNGPPSVYPPSFREFQRIVNARNAVEPDVGLGRPSGRVHGSGVWMKLVVAVGEVGDHVKKHIGHGHKLDKIFVTQKLSEAQELLAIIAHSVDSDLGKVVAENVAKLKKRYPSGFSHDASRNRAEYTTQND